MSLLRPAGVLLFLLAAAGSAADRQTFNTLGKKPFGVLLLGEGGDHDWKDTVDTLKKKAGARYPLEFAAGLADGREMQRGLDVLQAKRVKVVVIVPLFISSYGEAMDQNRYLLGIRETPSKELLQGPSRGGAMRLPRRLHSRVPLVLAKALDDHPLFVDILAARAKALSRRPNEEALILVGEAPADQDDEKEWSETAMALAEKVRQKGGFAAARAYALRTGRRDREKSAAGLKSLARDMRRKHAVIVVPLALTSAANLKLPSALDGLFVKYDGRSVLPDALIARWVDESAAPAATLPDMRMFQDAGKASPIPQGLKHEALVSPPALPKGDKHD